MSTEKRIRASYDIYNVCEVDVGPELPGIVSVLDKLKVQRTAQRFNGPIRQL